MVPWRRFNILNEIMEMNSFLVRLLLLRLREKLSYQSYQDENCQKELINELEQQPQQCIMGINRRVRSLLCPIRELG